MRSSGARPACHDPAMPAVPLLFAVALAALLLSCGGPAPAPAPRPTAATGASAASPPEPPLEILYDGPSHCRGGARDAAVLRDAESLRAWFSRVTCGSVEPPPVDFGRGDCVLVVEDAEAPNG